MLLRFHSLVFIALLVSTYTHPILKAEAVPPATSPMNIASKRHSELYTNTLHIFKLTPFTPSEEGGFLPRVTVKQIISRIMEYLSEANRYLLFHAVLNFVVVMVSVAGIKKTWELSSLGDKRTGKYVKLLVPISIGVGAALEFLLEKHFDVWDSPERGLPLISKGFKLSILGAYFLTLIDLLLEIMKSSTRLRILDDIAKGGPSATEDVQIVAKVFGKLWADWLKFFIALPSGMVSFMKTCQKLRSQRAQKTWRMQQH